MTKFIVSFLVSYRCRGHLPYCFYWALIWIFWIIVTYRPPKKPCIAGVASLVFRMLLYIQCSNFQVHGMQVRGKRKLYMIMFYACLQPLLIWWMTYFFIPSGGPSVPEPEEPMGLAPWKINILYQSTKTFILYTFLKLTLCRISEFYKTINKLFMVIKLTI